MSAGTIPDYIERKGSLFLRSNQMNYGRATLNSNWHQAREAEPKHYDINKADNRDMGKATYQRIGNVTDGSINKTTYQDHSEQIYLKKDFEEKETKKSMVTLESLNHANIDREINTPKKGYDSVLPRHNSDHNKLHVETTHRADYTPPIEFSPAPERPPDFDDLSAAYRKCHSQFTDRADHRRKGWNTWQDESGLYANSHFKSEVFKPTETIPSNVE